MLAAAGVPVAVRLQTMVKSFIGASVAVFGLLLVSLAIAVLTKIPVILWLELTRSLAPSCVQPLPSDVPQNAGALVTLNVRRDKSGREFAIPASDWNATVSARLASSTERQRDLVVYVHGFNTSGEDARCVGEMLRIDLAGLPQYQGGEGPDVLVFVWPSEFGFGFSTAQANAGVAGSYLAPIIGQTPHRTRYLVAHSLGSKVVMEAMSALPGSGDGHRIEGVLLAGGAIPATSIRTWSYTLRNRFPAAEVWSRSLADARPIEEKGGGIGEYVVAASRARHLVVTISGGDTVLDQAYSVDELIAADGKNRPLVPPWPGTAPRTLPQNLAVGSPFPESPIHGRFDHESKDTTAQYGTSANAPYSQSVPPMLRTPNPTRVLQSTEWTYDFQVPHSSFHEVRLDEGSWRPLYYWHGLLTDSQMRREVLSRAWAIFARSDTPK